MKKGYAFKIPDSDEIGIKFISKIITIVSDTKLFGIKGKIESYPASKEQKELIEICKKEFEKRCIEYIDLSKNDVFDSEK